MKAIVILAFTVSLLSPFSAFSAESTPLQLSLLHPLQIFPKETKVQGLRINLLYGVNDEMTGIDLGAINRTTGKTQGLQLGAFPFGGVNITGNLDGIQFGGFWGGVNLADGDVSGLQISGIFGGFNKAGNLNGAQIAGILLGVNLANNTKGIQIATLYNQAEKIKGIQIGFVNVCKQMTGVQIGLANVIKESRVPFLPVVNARF